MHLFPSPTLTYTHWQTHPHRVQDYVCLSHLSEIIQFSGWIRLCVPRAEIKIKILNKQEALLFPLPPSPSCPFLPPYQPLPSYSTSSPCGQACCFTFPLHWGSVRPVCLTLFVPGQCRSIPVNRLGRERGRRAPASFICSAFETAVTSFWKNFLKTC